MAKSDIARLMTGWDGLAYFDENYKIKLSLAEELEAEKANQYLIRVRDGIEFHNGKTLTIDDVIYSIRRTKNPKLKLFGNAAFGAIDLKRIKKLDKRTCRLFLSRPDITLLEAFAQYFQGVVPVGYQPNAVGKGPLRFVGTGPFKVQELHAGPGERPREQRELLADGQPYFDEVRIINFPDDAAKVNALLSGQIDAMTDVPFAQVPVVRRRNNLQGLHGADRSVDAALHAGRHRPVQRRPRAAGDAPARQPPADRAAGPLGLRPRRERHLLAVRPRVRGRRVPAAEIRPRAGEVAPPAAGQDGLAIELITSPQDTGMVEGATIFAAEREGRRRQRHRQERRRRAPSTATST